MRADGEAETRERIAELTPIADRELAKRSTSGGVMYVIVAVVVFFLSNIGRDFREESLLFISLLAVAAFLRIVHIRRFDEAYPANPRLWKGILTLFVLGPTIMWSSVTALVYSHYGLSLEFFMVLLPCLGIATGGASSLAPVRTLYRVFLVAMMGPVITVVFLFGGKEGVGTGVMCVTYLVFQFVIGKHFHLSYWEGLRKSWLLKCRAEDLETANREVVEANRLKGEFLANMSHEIRTPMNGIIGMTEIALDTELDDVQRGYLQDVMDSARSLLRIINGILDFSKIDAGRMELVQEEFSCRTVLRDFIRPLLLGARGKGLELNVDVGSNVPDRLIGDPGRLRQVMVNLVQNAIKFTSEGEVRIIVRLGARGGRRITLHFEVRDSGIGIPEDRQGLIFEPFRQVDGTTTREYGGTGLGLTISSRLVTLMEGRIRLESGKGRGTTFYVTLPFQIAESREDRDSLPADLPAREEPVKQPGPVLPEHGESGAIPRTTILLAEDNAVNRKLATVILKRKGFEVLIACNGREAVELHEKEKVDLILMDVQMPVLDGLGATREIRKREAREQRGRTPVIALTAHAMKGDRSNCLAAGMDDYITKPVNPVLLDETLSRWISAGQTA